MNPGWGDGVQANKAGLLEIADLFVVNKADRDGVAETVRDLEMMLDLTGEMAWRPKVIQTIATRGEGIDELWDAIGEHREFQERTGQLARRREDRLARRAAQHRARATARAGGRHVCRRAVRQARGPGRGARARPLRRGRRSSSAPEPGRATFGSVRSMTDDLVLTDVRADGVATLRLNRPPMNALSQALLGQIAAAALRFAADDAVKAVVVLGGEKAFAAGADISEFGDQAAAKVMGKAFRAAFDGVGRDPAAR